MTIRIKMTQFALLASACAAAQGCDSEPDGLKAGFERPDALDLEFRSGSNCDPRVAPCELANTNFPSHDRRFRLDNIPLVQGSDPNASVEEIVAYQCDHSEMGIIQGTFRAVAPDLTVDAEGNFGPTLFEDANLAGELCTVEGELFNGTEWYMKVTGDVDPGEPDTIEVKLRIADMTVASGQSTMYYWQTDLSYQDGAPAPNWQPTCDESPIPNLDYHSVIYPELRINEATGLFETDVTTAFCACTSGSVGKTGFYWGYDSQPQDVHQAVTYAATASYCGPLEGSFTEVGTDVALRNMTGNGPHQLPLDLFNEEDWIVEAGWNIDGEAVCMHQPRLNHVLNHTPGTPFDCDHGVVIPACTPQSVNDPSIALFTFAKL